MLQFARLKISQNHFIGFTSDDMILFTIFNSFINNLNELMLYFDVLVKRFLFTDLVRFFCSFLALLDVG